MPGFGVCFYAIGMDTYIRDDGRFMAFLERPDLFGPAVQVIYGGFRCSRVRIIPVVDSQEAKNVMQKLAAKRRRHGYRLVH